MFSAMDIYVIAVTPDLIFKCLTLHPVLYGEDIVSF